MYSEINGNNIPERGRIYTGLLDRISNNVVPAQTFRATVQRVKRRNPIFMFVGNKADKVHDCEVSKEEGAFLARAFDCQFIETSAKKTTYLSHHRVETEEASTRAVEYMRTGYGTYTVPIIKINDDQMKIDEKDTTSR
ncbi:hypothetical protein B0H13DRAFT_1854860 [Mycena leptocephala]|nr:hypothetical protein B0H13DRAFT_1854860 [Mycena leptocephala]